MSAFLLCFAAWSAMALGMDRHHEDATGREGAARRLQQLRRAGWLLLLLSSRSNTDKGSCTRTRASQSALGSPLTSARCVSPAMSSI